MLRVLSHGGREEKLLKRGGWSSQIDRRGFELSRHLKILKSCLGTSLTILC